MRVSLRVFAATLTLAILGCTGDRLTGTEAQDAFAEASSELPALPAGTLVFVDGVRVTEKWALELEPTNIHSIEVVKGDAARAIYGDAAARGVIHIRTIPVSDSTPSPSGS